MAFKSVVFPEPVWPTTIITFAKEYSFYDKVILGY